MQPPSAIGQVVVLVLLVLPGMSYQFLRERWRGPVAGEARLGERMLRAITASVALNGAYAVIAGPSLGRAWRKGERVGLPAFVAEHPRVTGLWVLVLFLGVPAVAAAGISFWERRRARSVHRTAPTAWDYVFGDRDHGGARFVRARLKDGSWVGGWYGGRSYASAHPQGADLYLQWEYRMGADGSFGPPVEGTAGIYLRMENIDIMELSIPPENDRSIGE